MNAATETRPHRDANAEYFPSESEHQPNGNGNGNGNGHHDKTPAQKAWQTARDRAADDARTPFYIGRDEELRALQDGALPDGAARLFCLIAKLSWIPGQGGCFKGRAGALAISARKLAKKMGSNVKSFYSKKRNGLVRPGWIESLVNGGYLWIGHHRIPNIPENKSLNVYNVAVFVPRLTQASLPWTDGNWGGEVVVDEPEETVPPNGNSHFSAQNGGGNAQSPEKGTPSGPKGELPVPPNGNSPSPETGIARSPKRARAVGLKGNRLSPETVTGCSPKRAQAVGLKGNGLSPETGHIRETLEGTRAIKTVGGGQIPPWEVEFAKWKFSLERQYPRELRATLEDLKAERTKLKEFGSAPGDNTSTAEQFVRVNRKIEAVKAKLNGPK